MIFSISDQEQRVFIKFGVIEGLNAAKIHRRLKKLLGSRAYSERSIREWVEKFKSGRYEVESQHGGGHQTSARTRELIEQVKQALDDNRRQSTQMLADRLCSNKSTIWCILTQDLGLVKKAANWVPIF